MTGTPNFGSTPQQAAYARLLEGFLNNDVAAVAAVVDAARFGAIIPGRGRLTLEEFTTYMNNLLGVTVGFGDNVTVLNCIEQAGTLAVLYRQVFIAGGTPVEQISTDWVTFNPQGEITELHVVFDLGGAQEQVFGRPLPRP